MSRYWLLGATAALFLVYAASGPRTLPEADSGEFAAVAVTGGIPHPPGYPLLVWVLRAFAALAPLLGLIPALALSSYLFACAAAFLLARTLVDRGVPAPPAVAATLAVFLSVNVWRDATSFEPFALNLFLACALLACCDALARTAADGGTRVWPSAIGALFGLGLCNHHSLAMLAPLPVAILLAEPRHLPRRAAWMSVGFVLGALPLLSLAWLRSAPGWVWGDWTDFWPQLLHHVLRRDYGTLTLSPGGQGALGDGTLRMLGTLPAVLSYVFLAPCALGLWRLGSTRAGRTDGFVIGLGASFVASGLVFPALMRLHDTPLENMIVDRFLALPMLMLAFPIAEGLAWLQARWRLTHAATALFMLAHVAVQWPLAARVQHRFFEAHVRNVFDLLEKDAVLMVVGDDGFAGGLYARYVLGRRDVTVVVSGVHDAWYRKQIAPALAQLTADQLRQALYLLDVPPTTLQFRTYPIGPLLRVLGPDENMPSPREVFARNKAVFSGLRLPSPRELANADAWERDVLPSYARTWRIIEERLTQQGDTNLAAEAKEFRKLFSAPGPGG